MSILWDAAEIIVAAFGICVVCSVLFFVWCVLNAAAERRIARRNDERDDEAIDMVTGPTDAEIIQAIDDWKKRHRNA